MTSILVFGGTFDPVHNGHLAIADQAREATGAAAVWFVPSWLPPLRERPEATAEDRLALVEAACTAWAGHVFAALDVAIRRGGVSYTAEVMEMLRAEHPDLDLAVLIGADAARTIHDWHRADHLLGTERFVIVNRTGPPPLDPAEVEGLGFGAARTTLLTVDSPDISASEVRRRCAHGEPLDGLVPDVVASLIATKGMYRENRDDA